MDSILQEYKNVLSEDSADEDEEPTTLTINCLDYMEMPLTGAIIDIYSDQNLENLVKTVDFESEEDITTVSVDLPVGEYWVYVSIVPDGYIMPDTKKYIVEANKANVWNIVFTVGMELPEAGS